MLELKNIYMNYGDNKIYDQAYFCAKENELTVVIGKSGSGKSTLHEILTFQGVGQCEYIYNDIDISNLSNKEQKDFIRKHMGIVNQAPTFINDLTVEDNIHLCQSLFQGFNVDEIARRLEIEHTYHMYPQQLSGGEKIRVSILLAMITCPDIVVFDEPTASLDRHHTSSVVEMLKQYAREGHIVIIFTHDTLIKKEADIIYEINNQKLICTKKENKPVSIISKPLSKIKTKHYLQYVYKMLNHHRILKITMIIFIALSVGLCSFSVLYGQSIIQRAIYETTLLNKGGIFYRESQLFSLPFSIGEEEIKDINSLSYTKIWPYYYYIDWNNKLMDKGLVLYQNNKPQYSRFSSPEQTFCLASYNEDFSYKTYYSDKVINNEEGVHVSLSLLYYLKTGNSFADITMIGEEQLAALRDEIDKDTEIEFPIAIPMYRTIEEESEIIHYEVIKIKSKIKSIVNNYNFYMGDIDGQFIDIYFSGSIIEEYQKKLSHTIPKGVLPYYPNYYQFVVNNPSDYLKAKEEVESLGFKVISTYGDALEKVNIVKELNQSIYWISGLIMIVVLLMFFGIKYNQKQDYIDFIKFFTNKGISSYRAKKILFSYFLYEGIICAMFSSFFMIICAYIYNVFIYNEIQMIQPIFFLYCIILSICVEVMIPIVTIGRVKK